jgi:exopolysaccharide production protein ExoY
MTLRIKAGVGGFDDRRIAPSQSWLLPRRERLYRRFFKRAFDVCFVILALPIVLPAIAVIALFMSLDGHSPFYTQKRLGLGGRVFTLWKIRTMVPDADAKLAQHLAQDEAARHEWNAYQKLACDPRITPLGHFMRKSSLDELPQLWNVLKGDMSLVGPRPMMPEQRSLYPGQAYFMLRPGLTGLWQVSDRNTSTFAQRADFDTTYDRRLSFATDLRVLVATVGVVLRGTGY